MLLIFIHKMDSLYIPSKCKGSHCPNFAVKNKELCRNCDPFEKYCFDSNPDRCINRKYTRCQNTARKDNMFCGPCRPLCRSCLKICKDGNDCSCQPY
jgi:hypothetical protein